MEISYTLSIKGLSLLKMLSRILIRKKMDTH